MFVFYILLLPWRSGEFKLTFCVVELGLTGLTSTSRKVRRTLHVPSVVSVQ